MHLTIPRRALLPLTSLAFVLMTTGCQAAFRKAAADAPHAAVPAVVDETLKAGEDAPTRERLVEILETPEMQRAIAEVAKDAVAAALDETSSKASEERIAELTRTVARALAQSLASEVVPTLIAGTRASLRESVSSDDVAGLRHAVSALAADSTRAALRAAAKEIPTTVAPAVRESLVRELQDPELHGAVSGLVGDAARQAILSTRDTVVSERMKTVAEGRVGVLDRLDNLVSTFSWAIAIGFAVIVIALVAWLLHMRRQTRRFRSVLLELLSGDSDGDRKSVPDPVHAQRLRELLS